MNNLEEQLTSKTIRPTDKIKVARVIADMLGVDKAESMTPEAAINTGLRKIKNKRMTPELLSILKKMLNLAQEVGVKVDMSLMPAAMKEEAQQLEEMDKVTPLRASNMASDILRLKDYVKLQRYAKAESKVGHGHHPVKEVGEDEEDQIRRMKVKYKTEENVDEQSIDYDTGAHKEKMEKRTDKAQMILRQAKEREALASRHHAQKEAMKEDEIKTADYKTTKDGKKYRAHDIHIEEVEDTNFEVLDLSDDELDALVNTAEFEDLVDVLDDDEVAIIDQETGEEIEDDESVNEEALMEVLSRSERMKAKIRFMRTKAKRERKMQIALKRRADAKTLAKRSRRMAIKLLKQKLAKKPVSKMSVSEKERVERMIQQRRALIDRLALRLAPKVRKMESDRLAGNKPSSPSASV
jgi:hypothetical protein